MLEPGTSIPDIMLLDDTGAEFSLRSLLGKPLVLYFYPKDDTPGCSSEASQFRDLFSQFQKKGVKVVGVSRDGVGSHCKFKEKFELPYPLLADVDSKLYDAFGVGRQRSTFLIDAAGVIIRVWPKVSVDGHAEEVLAAVP
jgi:thioredoxin-dependent peroxiredoxin